MCGRGGVVRAVAHGDDGDARGADRVTHGEGEVAVDRHAERDRAAPLHEIPGERAGIDDCHRAFDVNVVRREDDRDVRTCRGESPPQLHHARGRRARERRILLRFRLGDRDRAVRRDRRKDKALHFQYVNIARLAQLGKQ